MFGDDKHSERCNASWTDGSITSNADCRRGTLYGVHALLRSLGFDWLWPGASGMVLPPTLKDDGVRLGKELNLSDAPDLILVKWKRIGRMNLLVKCCRFLDESLMNFSSRFANFPQISSRSV